VLVGEPLALAIRVDVDLDPLLPKALVEVGKRGLAFRRGEDSFLKDRDDRLAVDDGILAESDGDGGDEVGVSLRVEGQIEVLSKSFKAVLPSQGLVGEELLLERVGDLARSALRGEIETQRDSGFSSPETNSRVSPEAPSAAWAIESATFLVRSSRSSGLYSVLGSLTVTSLR
jgi:hypothetical protein